MGQPRFSQLGNVGNTWDDGPGGCEQGVFRGVFFAIKHPLVSHTALPFSRAILMLVLLRAYSKRKHNS